MARTDEYLEAMQAIWSQEKPADAGRQMSSIRSSRIFHGACEPCNNVAVPALVEGLTDLLPTYQGQAGKSPHGELALETPSGRVTLQSYALPAATPAVIRRYELRGSLGELMFRPPVRGARCCRSD